MYNINEKLTLKI